MPRRRRQSTAPAASSTPEQTPSSDELERMADAMLAEADGAEDGATAGDSESSGEVIPVSALPAPTFEDDTERGRYVPSWFGHGHGGAFAVNARPAWEGVSVEAVRLSGAVSGMGQLGLGDDPIALLAEAGPAHRQRWSERRSGAGNVSGASRALPARGYEALMQHEANVHGYYMRIDQALTLFDDLLTQYALQVAALAPVDAVTEIVQGVLGRTESMAGRLTYMQRRLSSFLSDPAAFHRAAVALVEARRAGAIETPETSSDTSSSIDLSAVPADAAHETESIEEAI